MDLHGLNTRPGLLEERAGAAGPRQACVLESPPGTACGGPKREGEPVESRRSSSGEAWLVLPGRAAGKEPALVE